MRELLAPSSAHAALGLVGVYFGVVLLIAAWALLGRLVRSAEPPSPRALLVVLAVWAVPLLLAPPLFSRDVYSYLAQGAMVDAHIDVYTYGPAQLGGPLADEVAPLWQHTGAPYGPVFIGLASALSGLTRGELPAGLFGMRVVALLGVGLMAAALPRLARHSGADPSAALWLGALNPLVLLHLVAGAHNDAIMLGLLGLGLVAALGRWPVLGAVLVTLAALVKAPAVLGLAAVVLLQVRAGRHPAKAIATTTVAAVATTVAATAVAGTGYGWIGALNTPVSPQNWALTSLLGRATRAVLEQLGSDLAPLADTGLARPGHRPRRGRRPRHLAAAAPPPGVRARPEPGRGGRTRPGDPALVRPVGPVPHRRRRAQHLGTAPGGGRDRRARARRPAERRPRGRRPTRSGRLRAASSPWSSCGRPTRRNSPRRWDVRHEHGPAPTAARLLLVLALATAVAVFTATVPLLRDWFDLRVYYGGRGQLDPPRRPPLRLPGARHDVRLHLSAVRRARHGCRWRCSDCTPRSPSLCCSTWRPWPWCCASWPDPGWRRLGWYGCALAVCALALFEPLRDTFSFGQVNLLLLALVLADAWLLATGRGRWAGIGIGLAAAVKLTPAMFIGMLLLGRRWRAAAVATAVTAAATALAACVAPGRVPFLLDRGAVGHQPGGPPRLRLQPVAARGSWPGSATTDRATWAVVVLIVLGVWAFRTRRAVAAGEWATAFALTGLTACLVSPITWVHHLVWLLPAFAVLVRTGHPRLAGALYAVLCTSVVWLWFDDASGIDGFLGSNTYTWITLGLLLWLPVGQLPVVRTTLPRSARATAPAPSPAAPAIAPVRDQPPPASAVRRGGAGSAAGPACGTDRSASSEPTGLTRPAASNPQSSSSRASSYTAKPPPA